VPRYSIILQTHNFKQSEKIL